MKELIQQHQVIEMIIGYIVLFGGFIVLNIIGCVIADYVERRKDE